MALRPISVSQLNEYISRVLTNDTLLMNVSVAGEISNLKYHSSGHVYFSINDENSKVNCFFPASYVRNLSYELGDGLEIIVTGNINVYKKGGYYSLFVRHIEVAGEGNLAMAFQLLKDKLEGEGIFNPAHKKPIPKYPVRIGVVTSATGAAVQDILKIITSRNSLVDVTVFPVPVQGDGAAADIARMIDYINSHFDDIDTLIVGRGGGSTEDLWTFNEEVLARAVYNSRIPVISAVGHEIDFTICDFAADLRAETPTAAAEIAVPDISEILKSMEKDKHNLVSELISKVKYDELKVESSWQDMKIAFENLLDQKSHQLDRLKLILDSNNPGSILNKGYAIIENSGGTPVVSPRELIDGEYTIRLAEGRVKVRITNV